MHGKGERTEAAHARAARASEWHGRALLPCVYLLALVALLLAPTRAFADGGGGSHYFGGDSTYKTVLYFSEYDGSKQYIVGADSKYDAAAYICGQTVAQVASYDDATRNKLSTTENDFSALADSLEKDWPTWNEDSLALSLSETFSRNISGAGLWDITLFENMTNPIYGGTLSLFQVGYWQDNVDCDIYAVDTTSDVVTRARDDLQEILNGGGDVGDTGNYYVFRSNTQYRQQRSSYFYDYIYPDYSTSGIKYTANNYFCNGNAGDNGTYTLMGSPLTVLIDKQLIPDGFTIGENSVAYISIRQGKLLFVTVYRDVTKNYLTNAYVNNDEYINSIGMSDSETGSCSISIPSNSSAWSFDGNTLTLDYAQLSVNIVPTHTGNLIASSSEQIIAYAGSDGGNEPDLPSGPGNWPSTPTNPNPDPEPPTVPDPPQNPEPDPPSTPVAPTPPPLEPPTNVTIPTGTTAADYTPWLRAILEQLQTLTNELASHCVHLQEEMQQSVNDLSDTLIYRFNSLENYLKDLFDGLEYYLCDMAEWLAEQLNFNVNVDPYDDSSVLYWLRQIYSRLGNQPKAPTTVMDPDPTEPFDFWAWLMNLIANTVGGIIGDLVGDVAGLLDLFKDKFPFSIPWDIAALLTLLDGTRATPAFDVKIAAVQGWWQETTFRIDLSPFDPVASACRTMVNILWVMVLVMKTDWMLAIMGDATSFGERFARKVARTS